LYEVIEEISSMRVLTSSSTDPLCLITSRLSELRIVT
jgi:hypothetical protein